MPSENQLQEKQDDQIVVQYSVNRLVKNLWNSLQYSLDHIQSTEKRGVTWVNDFQFIINFQIFSKYMNLSMNDIKTHLSNQGFTYLGTPSKEILTDFEISDSSGWYLCMKHRFTPNSEDDDLL